MDSDLQRTLVYEHMLLSRHVLQDVPPYARESALDRSATVLLARLEAEGPMTVGELADAFGLDVSTVHRQVTAAMKGGLIERIRDPEGGVARKHRPTEEGSRRLAAELKGRREATARATAGWSEDDIAAFVTLLRQFNESVEAVRGRPWPRGD